MLLGLVPRLLLWWLVREAELAPSEGVERRLRLIMGHSTPNRALRVVLLWYSLPMAVYVRVYCSVIIHVIPFVDV